MTNKVSISLAALAAMGIAGAASAQNVTGSPATVNIDVVVEQIAELEVTNNSATATIDDSTDRFMGNPSSLGNDFSNVARLELRSNFAPTSITVDFPRVSGIKNFSSATWFGEATCISSGGCGGTTTLGVYPQISKLDGSGNFINGGGVNESHGGGNSAIVYGTTGVQAISAGVTGFGLGVATNWDRTLVGEPTYAGPGQYQIALTATINP